MATSAWKEMRLTSSESPWKQCSPLQLFCTPVADLEVDIRVELQVNKNQLFFLYRGQIIHGIWMASIN